MKKTVFWIIGILLLVAVILGASSLYKNLSSNFGEDESTPSFVVITPPKDENDNSEITTKPPVEEPTEETENTTENETEAPTENENSSSETESVSKETETEVDTETETETDAPPPEIVFKAADFTVTDMNGKVVRLSDMKGKIIVVNFWATWCTYCKMEMPDFQEMYEKYGDEVVFMMVNYKESKSVVSSFINKEGYTFPVYFDTNGMAAALYGVSGFPTTFFFNEDGSFVARASGAIPASTIEQGIAMVKEESIYK